MNKHKKGQIFTLDVIAAVIIFITILILAFYGWEYTTTKIYENEVRNEMEFVARNAASALVLTSGEPSSWNNTILSDFNTSTTAIKSLGLAVGQPGILDMQKVFKLENYSTYPEGYATIKKLLGVNPYEIYIEFYDWNRIKKKMGCTCNYAVGALPPLDTKEVARVNRIALSVDSNKTALDCDGQYSSESNQTYWTRVVVKVWKNETR